MGLWHRSRVFPSSCPWDTGPCLTKSHPEPCSPGFSPPRSWSTPTGPGRVWRTAVVPGIEWGHLQAPHPQDLPPGPVLHRMGSWVGLSLAQAPAFPEASRHHLVLFRWLCRRSQSKSRELTWDSEPGLDGLYRVKSPPSLTPLGGPLTLCLSAGRGPAPSLAVTSWPSSPKSACTCAALWTHC